MNNILKIVLTGGPMAGKSSTLRYLKKHFKDRIMVIPEIATNFEKNFFRDKYFFSKILNKDLSKLFFSLQIELEAIYLKVAEKKGVDLIVCDRGLFDGAAYYNGSINEFLNINKSTSDFIYGRYDIVIWLETLVETNKDFVFRRKAITEKEKEIILKISRNNLKYWKLHHNFYSIKSDSFEEKRAAVIKIIYDLLKDK